MQAMSLDRSNLAQTALVWVLTVAALALLALVLARWTWALLAPPTEAAAPSSAVGDGRAEAARALFGNAPAASQAAAAATSSAIKLLGVVAANGGHGGYALLQLEGKPTVAVREGEAVADGVRLQQVSSDHVVLERSGVAETLALPVNRAPMQTLPPPATQ